MIMKNKSSAFFLPATTALLALVCFLAVTDVPALWWAGLAFYLLCLAMFVQTLVPAMFRARQITADVLIVAVMIVSLLDGKPLSGALVACFISAGLVLRPAARRSHGPHPAQPLV